MPKSSKRQPKWTPPEPYVHLTYTRKRALELGLLVCGNCGYPANNHFDFPDVDEGIGDYGRGPSARDNTCRAYKEVQKN